MSDEELDRAAEEYAEKTKNCIPLGRMGQIGMQNSTPTDYEMEHLAGCRFCARTVNRLKEESDG